MCSLVLFVWGTTQVRAVKVIPISRLLLVIRKPCMCHACMATSLGWNKSGLSRFDCKGSKSRLDPFPSFGLLIEQKVYSIQ